MDTYRLTLTIIIIGIASAICTQCAIAVGFVQITNLYDGDYVSWRDTVEGNSSAIQGSGLNVYALIWPLEADGPWWVQPTKTYSDGYWYANAYFGRDTRLYPEDVRTHYKVVAIMTEEDLRGGQTFKDLPIKLRSEKSNEIIVTRSNETYENVTETV